MEKRMHDADNLRQEKQLYRDESANLVGIQANLGKDFRFSALGGFQTDEILGIGRDYMLIFMIIHGKDRHRWMQSYKLLLK